ncbi:MAG: fructose-6-phosphate aldolase [Planctomycetaceae bacterium]|nr:fructose-6-phosphate aldolase [Planctomycetaceae bacterium]
MLFFIDTADVNEIREANELGILDGVTTNPSLVAKSGRVFEDVAKEILKIVDGPVSLEVTATDKAGMLAEAEKLLAWGKNVVIKLPLIAEGLKACKALTDRGVKTNVTLCFSANQALLAAKAGATYVSPFIGRLDDIGENGMVLIRDIRKIYNNYGFKTKILAASIRHPIHVFDAALAGADVSTIPFKVFTQLVQHPLTDKGLATFLADWQKAKK